MALTFGDICCGGGGASLGMLAAGLRHGWAIDAEPEIAELYRANVGDVICSPAQNINPCDLQKVDVLWCSFPCQAFSVARSKKLGQRSDADLGAVVLVEQKFLQVLQPRYVFLENVPQYAKSQPFKKIVNHLYELGYWVDFQILNAADWGVPQTRQRLILRAVKDGFVPPLPPKQKWRGWYEAITDLIPTLPSASFAPWQLLRMPELVATSLVDGRNTIRPCTVRNQNEPSPCVTAHWLHRPCTIPRAFVVDGKNISRGEPLTIRDSEEPHFTITASLLDRPCHTPKAFIVDSQNSGSLGGLTTRHETEPVFTLLACAQRRPARAWLEQGRVVAMTPRALARFQSFPDSYQLPENRTLASRVIGNAAPPKIVQGLLESIKLVC